MKSVLNPARLHSFIAVSQGDIISKISFTHAPASRNSTRKHAWSSLSGLLAALADGHPRESRPHETNATERRGSTELKKPQAYQNRPDARPAERDAGIPGATQGLHVLLWNCQSYFWHSTEQ